MLLYKFRGGFYFFFSALFVLNCSFFSYQNNSINDIGSNYIGTTSPGIFQKVSEKKLAENKFKIKSIDVRPNYTQIETYWENSENLAPLFFPEETIKSRVKIILTTTINRNKNFDFNPDLNDCYIQLINEIYDGSKWKKIKPDNELQKILSKITFELRNDILNYKN